MKYNPDFQKRTVHSSRCSDEVWRSAQAAAEKAGCSMSVFNETALALLTSLIEKHSLRIDDYDSEMRWLEELKARLP